MMTRQNIRKPVRGMIVTFKDTASQTLAGIPATVIDIWPRFRSGDYLVTLEYAAPVKFRQALIRHIDAFVSELDTVEDADRDSAGHSYGLRDRPNSKAWHKALTLNSGSGMHRSSGA